MTDGDNEPEAPRRVHPRSPPVEERGERGEWGASTDPRPKTKG